MRHRIRGAIFASAATVAAATFSLAVIPTAGQGPAIYKAPRSAFKDGKPDLNGIWQANNTANWDLQDHAARRRVGIGEEPFQERRRLLHHRVVGGDRRREARVAVNRPPVVPARGPRDAREPA